MTRSTSQINHVSKKALCLAMASCHLLAYSLPAQKPLLTASAGPLPNVVLTLDDSGSMNFMTMPDSVGDVRLGLSTYERSTTAGACRNVTRTLTRRPTSDVASCYRVSDITYVTETSRPRYHPNDDFMLGRNYSGVADTNTTTPNGADNIYGMRIRTASINGLYYNPRTTYKPWPAPMRKALSDAGLIDADGNIKDFTKVPVDPSRQASTTTVDISRRIASSTSEWCYTGMVSPDGTSDASPSCPTATRIFDPAVYYTIEAGTTGTKASDFTRVNINDLPNAADKAKQLRNFANWFTYYRTRLFMAKSATGIAFSQQPDDKFRLGYGRINRGVTFETSTTYRLTPREIDGFNSVTLERGVRSFGDTTGPDATYTNVRTNFFNWLVDLDGNGGTALRVAMNDVGQYYSSSSAKGDPYKTNPTVSSEAALSCRKNFHILVTDGYWNDGSFKIADQDGTAGTKIVHNDPSISYTYSPKAPYSDTYANTLADVAMRYWKNDLRTDLVNDIEVSKEDIDADLPSVNIAFWQHMVNFTVGLGVDGTLASTNPPPANITWPQPVLNEATTIDDLWHAAVNSRGRYLSAKEPSKFAAELGDILSDITASGGTVSGVALSRATLAGGGTLKFIPSFEPAKWSGELAGVKLTSNGKDDKDATPWLASRKVPAHGDRKIWMGTPKSSTAKAAEFKKDDFSTSVEIPLGHLPGIGTDGTRQTIPAVINDDLINYLRGDSSKEETLYRKRATFIDGGVTKTNVLGDFINSLPLYVKGADFGNRALPSTVNGTSTGSSTYSAHVVAKRKRNGIVLIGGNDGMLHGFDDSGIEKFAFIPFPVLRGDSHPNSKQPDPGLADFTGYYGLARLADKNYQHQFYMDGQITEADISSCAAGICTWKNIAVASTGGGAKNVFALDVTNTNAFKDTNVLWSIDSTLERYGQDLGYVMAPVEVGLLPSGQWAAIFGNGYDSASGRAKLFVVDANTGSVITAIAVGAGTDSNNGLGGVTLVRNSQNIVVQAYAGDLKGNIWKFDLTGNSSTAWVADFENTPLFTATKNGKAQPITAAPSYAVHPTKGLMVVVATGKLYATTDTSGVGQQTIYGLWDQAPIGKPSLKSAVIPANLLNSKVVQATDATRTTGATFNIINDPTATSPGTTSRGWKLDMLRNDGEMGIYTPSFVAGYTFVETVIPGKTAGESCSIGEGSGYAYLINTFTGAEASKAVIDVSGNGTFSNSEDAFGVFKRTGVGRGVVVNGEPGSIQSPGGGLGFNPLSNQPQRTWRQIFNLP